MNAFAIFPKPQKEKYIIQVEFDGEITLMLLRHNKCNTIPLSQTHYYAFKNQLKVIEVDLNADPDTLTDLFNKTAISMLGEFMENIRIGYGSPHTKVNLTQKVTMIKRLEETTSNTNINLGKTN